MNSRTHHALVAVVLFALAVAVRVSFVTTMEPRTPMGPDSIKYTMLASNLLNQGVYSYRKQPQGNISFIVPAYPLLLAASMDQRESFEAFYLQTTIIQAILWGVSSCLVYLLLSRAGHWQAGLAAAALTALCPHLIVISGYLLTESLFVLLSLGALFFLSRWFSQRNAMNLVAFGLLAAAASLARPVFLLVPFLFLVYAGLVMTNRPNRRCVLAVVLSFLLVYLPWEVWKRTSVQEPDQPSLVRESFHLGSYPDFTYAQGPKGYPRFSDPEFKRASRDWESTLRHFADRASHQPGTHLAWYLAGKPVTFWQWDMIQGQGGPFIYPLQRSGFFAGPWQGFLLTAYRETRYPLVLLAAVTLLLIGRRLLRKSPPAGESDIFLGFLGLILLYYTAVHMVLAPLPRYSLVLLPLVYALAAYLPAELHRTYKELRHVH